MEEAGDYAWAFYLKHRAEIAKGKMEEADREAAREIYDYYNPSDRKDKNKVDVHGLTVREAIKAAEEALRDVQAAGGTQLTVVTGKGKHSESGKSSIRPAMREFFENQGLSVSRGENDGMLLIKLPKLRIRDEYQEYILS